jgi:hypothetical protein
MSALTVAGVARWYEVVAGARGVMGVAGFGEGGLSEGVRSRGGCGRRRGPV